MKYWAHQNGRDLADARNILCTCGAQEKNLMHSDRCYNFPGEQIVDRVAKLCYKLRTGFDSVIESV